MKKQKIQLIVLACICVLCIAGYFIVSNMNFSEEETTETVQVTDFNAEDVTEIVLEGDNNIHLIKDGESWKNADDESMNIDSSEVTVMLNSAAAVSTDSVIENPEDLSQYGVDTPSKTITLTMSDYSTLVIKVGNQMEMLGQYYIQLEGDSNVYLVTSSVVLAFNRTPEDLIAEDVSGNDVSGNDVSGNSVSGNAASEETETESSEEETESVQEESVTQETETVTSEE